MIYLQLVAGFIYLLGGGDLLVRGGTALARRARVPNVAVALSVVAFGTSMPELMVSVRGSLAGYPDLVLGNVVGSNIANILLVGGVAAALHPLRTRDASLRRTGTMMLFVTLVFAALCIGGDLSRTEGFVLLAGFVGVFALSAGSVVKAYMDQDTTTPLDWVLGLPSKLPMIVLFLVLGSIALPLGADLLVEASVEIAESLGVSATVVGLSLVAIGTSLPEVATAATAVIQRRQGMALGTIVGSNTFNILAIMGVATAISPEPVAVSSRFLGFDLPIMLATSGTLVVMSWFGRRITKGMGVAAVALYLLYLGVLFSTA